jgi:hypothetical protein
VLQPRLLHRSAALLGRRRDQEPIPKPLTHRKRGRKLLLIQRGRQAFIGRIRTGRARPGRTQVRRQRSLRTTTRAAPMPSDQQIPQVHAATLMKLVERRYRRQLPVHRRLRTPRRPHPLQRHHIQLVARRVGQPQPWDEPADILRPTLDQGGKDIGGDVVGQQALVKRPNNAAKRCSSSTMSSMRRHGHSPKACRTRSITTSQVCWQPFDRP